MFYHWLPPYRQVVFYPCLYCVMVVKKETRNYELIRLAIADLLKPFSPIGTWQSDFLRTAGSAVETSSALILFCHTEAHCQINVSGQPTAYRLPYMKLFSTCNRHIAKSPRWNHSSGDPNKRRRLTERSSRFNVVPALSSDVGRDRPSLV